MPLKLLSPRKTGRKFYYVRGVLCGKRYFESTKETDRSKAEIYKDKFEKAIRSEYAGKSSRMTFAAASQAYIAFRNPSKRDLDFIEKINLYVGSKFVDEVVQNDLVDISNTLYPKGSPATKNRAVIRPTAAILHYASLNKWCSWLRVSAFKEPESKARYVMPEVESKLHIGLRAKGTRWRVNKRLLLLWLFRQGDRISDVLRIRYEDCDFERMEVHRHISKSDTYVTLPLDETICRYLRRTGKKEGKIFMWHTHHGANRWMQNLSKRLNVTFTPHMARHTVGKRLNDSGVAVRTIMAKLGHKDMKSSIRYQTTDIETVRRASASALRGSKNGSF